MGDPESELPCPERLPLILPICLPPHPVPAPLSLTPVVWASWISKGLIKDAFFLCYNSLGRARLWVKPAAPSETHSSDKMGSSLSQASPTVARPASSLPPSPRMGLRCETVLGPRCGPFLSASFYYQSLSPISTPLLHPTIPRLHRDGEGSPPVLSLTPMSLPQPFPSLPPLSWVVQVRLAAPDGGLHPQLLSSGCGLLVRMG